MSGMAALLRGKKMESGDHYESALCLIFQPLAKIPCYTKICSHKLHSREKIHQLVIVGFVCFCNT